MMKLSKEAKIGITAIITFGLFLWGFNFLKGKNIFKRTHTFYAVYNELSGLKESGSILINGYKVGQVNDIYIMRENQNKLLVQFLVEKDIKVPVGSIAELKSVDIMNTMAINLILSESDRFHVDGDTLNTRIEKGLLESIEPLQKKFESITSSLDTFLISMNSTFDTKTREDLQNSIKHIENSTSRFADLMKENGELSGVITDIKELTRTLNETTDELPVILGNISQLTDTLKESNLKMLLNNTEKLLASADSMLVRLNQGVGSAGKFLTHDSLYIHLSNATNELELLLNDLRNNPKKYVHFSIFGNKNEN